MKEAKTKIIARADTGLFRIRRGTPPFAYLHLTRISVRGGKKKKKEIQFTPRRQTEFSAAEITAFIGAAVNLACKLPDTREFAGATFEPRLNGDLRAVGVPRRFFLCFFFFFFLFFYRKSKLVLR